MATTKPRITITLSDRQYQLIKAITESSGHSMSGMIVDLLESAEPILEKMAVTFQKMKQATDLQRSHLAKSMDEAQAALEPLALAGLDQFDLFLGKIESVSTGADSATGAARLSPSTNRGVTPNPSNTRKPTASKPLKPVSKNKVLKKTKG